MPIGVGVQEYGLYQQYANWGMRVPGEDYTDGYTRNRFGLPGLDVVLSPHGIIGAAVYRDERDAERRAEKERLQREKEDEKKARLEKEARKMAAKKVAEQAWKTSTGGAGGGGNSKVTFVDMTAGRRRRYYGYDDD